MLNEALFSSKTDQHWTPDDILADIHDFFPGGFFDPCPRGTPDFDGLTVPWKNDVFCNPPYGRTIGQWTAKALYEYECYNARQVLLLVPARTDTRWMRPLLTRQLCFVHGRLRFGEAQASAPFPSVLIYLGDETRRFRGIFSRWGTVLNG